MDDLSDPVHLEFDLALSARQTGLTEIDRIRKHRTPGVNPLRIGSFLEFNAFAFQELVEIFVKFVFLYSFHKLLRFAVRPTFANSKPPGNYRAEPGL